MIAVYLTVTSFRGPCKNVQMDESTACVHLIFPPLGMFGCVRFPESACLERLGWPNGIELV